MGSRITNCIAVEIVAPIPSHIAVALTVDTVAGTAEGFTDVWRLIFRIARRECLSAKPSTVQVKRVGVIKIHLKQSTVPPITKTVT